MKAKAFAFKFIYTFVLTFVIAVVMGLAAPAVTGAPITFDGFLNGFCIGMVIGMVIGLVLPVERMQNAFCSAVGAKSQLAQSFVGPLLIATIIFTTMNFCFTAINTGFGTFMTDAGPITFMNRFMATYPILWAYVYLSVVVSNPLAFAVAHKITKFPPLPGDEQAPAGTPATEA